MTEDNPAGAAQPVARIAPELLVAPSDRDQQRALLNLLWAAVPKPLTLQLARHVMTFSPSTDGQALTTGRHGWGPLLVDLTVSRAGTVYIAPGSNTLTGQALDTKTLLDLADTVHGALVHHAVLGPLFAAMNAVANQRFDGDAVTPPDDAGAGWESDAAVTRRALARLR